jgi:hypothetical protein
VNQSQRFSSTQFRPALQFFAPGEILAPEQTLSFLRRKVASWTNCLPLTLKLGGRDASGPMLIG